MEVNRKVVELALDDILPNRFQPRIKFNEDSLNELAESIKEHGVIQPIVVRAVGDKYEIIAGERRYKASVLANKTTIPAIVTDLNDKDSAEVALIENVQRQNLTPIEEAISYKKILDMGYLNQTALAEKLGKNQSTIANKLRLLELDDEVQEALLNSKISERHARSLLRIQDKKTQVDMLNKIINERMTVRKTDEEIDKVLNGMNNDININNNLQGNVANNVSPQGVMPGVQQPVVEQSVQEPMSFESLFSNNPVNPTSQVNDVPIQQPVINENPFEVSQQPVESIDLGQQMNPGFVNVDKIVEQAQPLNPNPQPVDMSNFVSQYNPAPMNVEQAPSIENNNLQGQVEMTPEQELQPKKFFNILGETEQEQAPTTPSQPDTTAFNFDNLFQDVPQQSVNVQQPVTPQPVIEQAQNIVQEQVQPTPMVDPFQQNTTVAQTPVNMQPAVEPVQEVVQVQPSTIPNAVDQISVPNPMPEELSSTQVSQSFNFDSAIQAINECAAKLQQLGYKQEHDNFDLGDMYQVIFRIEK